MRVLGIDPGTNSVGYAILEKEGGRIRLCESGVIRTGRGQPIEKRLQVIHDSLQEVIRRTAPDEAAVEELVYGRSIRSALRSGEGRGVAILAAGSCGLPVAEYSPTKVKKAATGSGGARKGRVQEMVSRILDLEDRPAPDEADAMAIALCHCQRRRTGA
jgi:crossover junction endodeoxyribonuclease RuvC